MSGQSDLPADLDLDDIASAGPGRTWRCKASAAVLDGQAVMAIGPSGCGKSQLMFGLIAHGATLIADDAVVVSVQGAGMMVAALPDMPGLIEARGVGLLNADLAAGSFPLALAVDLGRAEPKRLPPTRKLVCGPAAVPLILAAGHPNLVPVLLHLLRRGRAQ